mmetsp:Transcript_34859/g.96190  ORF Transcript_34859/g.96190 Transcript_34859/m.96190 type:complete len:331 (-) Transcript_34859:657-1649(-)
MSEYFRRGVVVCGANAWTANKSAAAAMASGETIPELLASWQTADDGALDRRISVQDFGRASCGMPSVGDLQAMNGDADCLALLNAMASASDSTTTLWLLAKAIPLPVCSAASGAALARVPSSVAERDSRNNDWRERRCSKYERRGRVCVWATAGGVVMVAGLVVSERAGAVSAGGSGVGPPHVPSGMLLRRATTGTRTSSFVAEIFDRRRSEYVERPKRGELSFDGPLSKIPGVGDRAESSSSGRATSSLCAAASSLWAATSSFSAFCCMVVSATSASLSLVTDSASAAFLGIVSVWSFASGSSGKANMLLGLALTSSSDNWYSPPLPVL